MSTQRQKLRRWATAVAAVPALYVFWPVTSEFFIKWVEQVGLYDDPQSTVDRAVSGFFSYADIWWVQWAVIFAIGCVAGLWVDSFLRKLPSFNTAVTPTNFKRNEILKRNSGPYKSAAQDDSYDVASHVKFKMDGNIFSQSVGNYRSSMFTAPCEDKLFVMIFYDYNIADPMVRVYSTKPELIWRDMGISNQVLVLEVTGDFTFSEIAIDVFPAPGDMKNAGPIVGQSYDIHWLPDLGGWLDNPKVRHAYRLQTLHHKNG